MLTRAVSGTAAVLLGLGALTACSAKPADSGKVDVVAGFYPFQFLAQRIGGAHVAVTNLVQPGAEPHDLELKPSQIGELADADLVIYLKSFQPELDKAVEEDTDGKALDVATVSPLLKASEHNHEGSVDEGGAPDPHLWLDPVRFATVSDAIAAELSKKDPANAAEYTASATALRAELSALDSEFANGLKTCERREIVTSHAAFGYLADRYNLEQVSLTGLTPEDEPTPQRLAEVAKIAKEHHATTIFYETLVSPRVAETLASEVGAKTAVLDPLEGLPKGSTDDYFSVMRANLQALRTALGCS